MSYFRLLSERAVERATSALFSALAKDNALVDFSRMYEEFVRTPGTTTLPGFSMFEQGANRPLGWFLPRVKLSTLEVLRIYERMANQPLNELESVAEIASHIYPRGSEDRRLFMKFKDADQWLSPAMLFAAAAQYAGAEVESHSPSSVRMRLGKGVIDINPQGMWSNNRGERIESNHSDIDVGKAVTWFPATESQHPVLRALQEFGEEYSMEPVATLVALAVDENVVGKAFLARLARLEGSVVDKARANFKRDSALALQALDNCLAILAEARHDTIIELYSAAVPDLVSFRQLQAIVGAPSQVRPGRVTRQATLATWADKLREAYANS